MEVIGTNSLVSWFMNYLWDLQLTRDEAIQFTT